MSTNTTPAVIEATIEEDEFEEELSAAEVEAKEVLDVINAKGFQEKINEAIKSAFEEVAPENEWDETAKEWEAELAHTRHALKHEHQPQGAEPHCDEDPTTGYTTHWDVLYDYIELNSDKVAQRLIKALHDLGVNWICEDFSGDEFYSFTTNFWHLPAEYFGFDVEYWGVGDDEFEYEFQSQSEFIHDWQRAFKDFFDEFRDNWGYLAD